MSQFIPMNTSLMVRRYIRVAENCCAMCFVFCLGRVKPTSVQFVGFFEAVPCKKRVLLSPLDLLDIGQWMLESVSLPLNTDLEIILVDWSFGAVQSSLLRCGTN